MLGKGLFRYDKVIELNPVNAISNYLLIYWENFVFDTHMNLTREFRLCSLSPSFHAGNTSIERKNVYTI